MLGLSRPLAPGPRKGNPDPLPDCGPTAVPGSAGRGPGAWWSRPPANSNGISHPRGRLITSSPINLLRTNRRPADLKYRRWNVPSDFRKCHRIPPTSVGLSGAANRYNEARMKKNRESYLLKKLQDSATESELGVTKFRLGSRARDV